MDTRARVSARASRIDWVTDLVVGLLLLVGAVWTGWTAGSATWDASLLLVRGETVSATVIAVDHDYRLGRTDDVVVELPPPYSARAELVTPREDLEPGTAVATWVDPDDPQRVSLADDGWPWRSTLPLLLVPLMGLAGLFALGLAAFGRGTPDQGAESDAGSGPAPGVTGPPAD